MLARKEMHASIIINIKWNINQRKKNLIKENHYLKILVSLLFINDDE